MKNILFIGPYYQNDGWGEASRQYLRALSNTKHNIVSRPIYLNGSKSVYNTSDFNELECAISNVDIVIQNCLPPYFTSFPNVKNIGLGFFESTIQNTDWGIRIQALDELWVCSEFEKSHILKDVDTEVKVIPYPINIDKYDKTYISEEIQLPDNNCFKFYFIGENSYRKNISDLLLAFITEFSGDSSTQLVLKANVSINTKKDIINMISETEYLSGLKFLPNQIILIEDYISDNDMYALHQFCDCFVTASSAEGFCIPAFDAMGFGKSPIVNKNSSMSEYIGNAINGHTIKSHKVPCVAPDRPAHYLYTSKDYWYQVDVLDLMDNMQLARYWPLSKEESYKYTQEQLEIHSYNNVTKIMNEVL